MLGITPLITKRRALILFFGILLGIQLVYSFRSPSVGDSDNWLPIESYLPKFSQEGHDNFLIKTFLPIISEDYRLNSDIGEYLIVARDFSPEYLDGHQYLNRPLYPLSILIASKILNPFVGNSYGILFGISILLNFLFIWVAVVLLFYLLRDFFSLKVSLLSSLLLIFSPFVHTYITQPMLETMTVLGVVFSLWLLRQYTKKPSNKKLIIFSVLGGVVMLVKMFFAIPLFVLLLAIYKKRLKEGMIFALCFVLPTVIWYLWVTRMWGISYYVHEVQHWHMGIWLFGIFTMSFLDVVRAVVSAIPNFIGAVFHSFVFVPVVLAIAGIEKSFDTNKKIISYLLIVAVFALTFLINLYLYRHTFMLFPIVFPAAILGIERLARFVAEDNILYRGMIQLAGFLLIVYLSSINIYQYYNYAS